MEWRVRGAGGPRGWCLTRAEPPFGKRKPPGQGQVPSPALAGVAQQRESAPRLQTGPLPMATAARWLLSVLYPRF